MSRKGALLPSFFRKGRESMKKKYVSAMVLSVLLGAQCFAGQVQAANVSYDELGVNVDAAVLSKDGATEEKDLSKVDIDKQSSSTVYGVLATDKSTIQSSDENINVSVKNTGAVIGVSGDLVKSGANYTDAGHVILGEEGKTKDINISVTSTEGDAEGIEMARFVNNTDAKPGTVTVNGENLTINAYSEKRYAVGIWAQNNSTDRENEADRSAVTINAKNTTIIVNSGVKEADKSSGEYNNIGIVNYSQGIVKINNNLTIQAGTAISTRGNANTVINEDGTGTVKIDGDINFNYDKPTSGTAVDATVDINLTNADSYLNGNIFVNGNPYPPAGKDDVNSMSLGLSDGAQWTTDGTSFVNNLKLNDGIVNIVGDEEQAVTVTKLEGSGTVNMNTEKTADGFSAGTLNVNSVAADKTARLGVNFMGINADDIKDAKTDMASLASHVKFGTNGQGIDEKQMTATANVGEGLIKGAISADMVTDTATGGTGSIVEGSVHQNSSTTTMENMKNIAAVSIAAWRQEDSTLSQRLGDLRETTGGQGIWARVSRGEFEYSGEFKNQYNYFQIGWDMAKDDWHYGAAVSYNDGETTYSDGNGENSSTSLSLYGTRLLNDGQYFDIVLKAGRLNNKYDNYAAAGHTHGDYDAWGTEISGEYGKKIDLANDWFVTPQAQLSLMRIGSEDYTTSNGIHVDQDTLYSAVGRIGAEAGKKTAWGSLYAKASVLHDFAGDADTYLTYQGLSNSYSQDIGDTWYEAGFGANWKMSSSSYLYVDVIRTFGGDIKTPWQWNAGVRWGF